MTQLTLNIEKPSVLRALKSLIKEMDGVTIAKSACKRKSGLEEALEDVRAGRVHHADSVDDMFRQILGK